MCLQMLLFDLFSQNKTDERKNDQFFLPVINQSLIQKDDVIFLSS